MACCNTNNNNNNNNVQPTNGSYIYQTVVKIDQLQKEATMQSLCESCDATLMAQIYNTKPVSFILCSGELFTATTPDTAATTTSVFRIEDVRQDSVVLRLIDTTTTPDEPTCTNYTVIFCLNCACGLQCFQPICCEKCTGACNNAAAA